MCVFTLRCGSAADRLLRMRVRIPQGAWMSGCCECCVLSGSDLCDGLITRPEESYRLWCVLACDHETSRIRSLKPASELQKPVEEEEEEEVSTDTDNK
jgi:hypothetical protein